MWMPFKTSYGSVPPSPIGQIALTSWPAARSAFSSIHTRRSNGRVRFSERWRTLTGEAMVLPGRHTPPIERGDEVDHDLTRPEARSDRAVLGRAVADHDHLGVREHVVELR